VDQGLFIDEDANGEATLWRRDERHPVALCRQSDVAGEVWALIVAALSVAPQPQPEDEHIPWCYTEVGVRCSCGEWMVDEVCPGPQS
jgi:hypothetical protein